MSSSAVATRGGRNTTAGMGVPPDHVPGRLTAVLLSVRQDASSPGAACEAEPERTCLYKLPSFGAEGDLCRTFFGSDPSGCESDLVATRRPADEFTTVQMGAVRVGFCQSQIDEPIKLAAIPIHMNHVLKMRDFADDGITRDQWNSHRLIESDNLPHTQRAQPIGHGLSIGFRPAGTNHFLVRFLPASDQPDSIHAGSLSRRFPSPAAT